MKLKAFIVEDEQKSREILKRYLEKYCPQVEVLGEAENIELAFEKLKNLQPDLVFLDVEMPYGTAFDLLDRLPNREFETVFVTAYEQYAKDALNQQAAYYLLKPLEIDELIKAVDLVIQIMEKEELTTETLTPISKNLSDKITIPTQSGFEVLPVKDIVYCTADNNYTHVHLKNDKKLVSKTLKHFDDLLQGMGFCRIHKSHLINTAFVTAYNKGKGGSVQLGAVELPVSPSKKLDFFNYFQ
jgi:two-component system LytT family response regulator